MRPKFLRRQGVRSLLPQATGPTRDGRCGLAFSLCLALFACGHAQHNASHADTTQPPETLFRMGQALLQAGDSTRAEQYLASALRAGYPAQPAVRALVTTCIRAGRLRSALSYAAPYLADHPREIALRQLVASVWLALGEWPSAEREAAQVLAIQEASPEAHYLLALLQQQREPLSARGHFARYLALAPRGIHAAEAEAALTMQVVDRPAWARLEAPIRARAKRVQLPLPSSVSSPNASTRK